MKQLVLLISMLWSLTLTAAVVQPGNPISRYPNTPTFHPSDLMILAVTNISPPTNKNMKMGDLALQIVNSNKVVVLDGTNTLVVNTFTNGTNFYAVNSTAAGGDAGGTNSRQGGTLTITNLSSNPNVVTNILGAGTVTVTSNNLGTFTITGAASGVGVGLAPGTTTIVVDGSLNTRTNALIGDSSIIFSNLTTGQPVRGWFFSSNGAWNITVPQANDSNTVSRGIEQPFTNNWVWVDATKLSDGQTNFSSRAPPFTIGPGTNTVFDTNLTTRHISVSAAGASSSTNSLFQTNGVDVGSAGTVNWTTGVTGYLAGAVANLGVNVSGAVATGFETNQFTTNKAGSPVLGALWLNGTNGITPPMTNGARVGIEWTPVQRALRIGELGNNGIGIDPLDSTTITSNYWHATNIGFGSIAMGSNVMAKGPYSTVLNGIYNITHSNAVASSVLGGSNNIVYTNATFSTIVGGTLNRIRAGSDFGVIGGGDQNDIIGSDSATIGGGSSCDINIGSQNATIGGGSVNMITLSPFGTVSGGRNNSLDNSTDATIAGGQLNEIGTGGGPAAHAFIGGGNGNSIYLIGNFSVIAGGSDNDIGQNPTGGSTHGFIGGGAGHRINAGSDYSVIVGGKQNATSGTFPDYIQILGGTSNNVSATMGTAIGNYVTNETVNSVEIGHANLRKARVDVNGLKLFAWTNTTASVGGTLVVSNAPIASAGASETNLIAYTVPAHVLTNNNDRLTFRASGRFAATANAKQIKVVYGSETILDTGSQIVNSGAWTIEGEIIRTGNTSQSVNAEFHGAGESLFTTASSLDLAQTNNISTVLKLTSTAAGDGDVTNRSLTITWHPSP